MLLLLLGEPGTAFSKYVICLLVLMPPFVDLGAHVPDMSHFGQLLTFDLAAQLLEELGSDKIVTASWDRVATFHEAVTFFNDAISTDDCVHCAV